MNTHETYCSLETCKLLKEAGFDWSCRGYYDRQTLRFNFVWDHNGKGASTQCSAPTLDVAQRWLREVKGYYISMMNLPGACDWCIDVNYKNISYYVGEIENYEEALEAGIKKALGLILEKGE